MTEKRIKDINNCHKKREDRINLTVPKGEREMIQGHAARHNKSTNEFIRRAIDEAMERDRLFDAQRDKIIAYATSHGMSTEDQEELKKLVMAFDALKPVMPDIKSVYASRLPNSQKRDKKTFITPLRSSDPSK